MKVIIKRSRMQDVWMVTLAALLRENLRGKDCYSSSCQECHFRAFSVPPDSKNSKATTKILQKCRSPLKVQHKLVVNNVSISSSNGLHQGFISKSLSTHNTFWQGKRLSTCTEIWNLLASSLKVSRALVVTNISRRPCSWKTINQLEHHSNNTH